MSWGITGQITDNSTDAIDQAAETARGTIDGMDEAVRELCGNDLDACVTALREIAEFEEHRPINFGMSGHREPDGTGTVSLGITYAKT